jgi:hypothetical protein
VELKTVLEPASSLISISDRYTPTIPTRIHVLKIDLK